MKRKSSAVPINEDAHMYVNEHSFDVYVRTGYPMSGSKKVCARVRIPEKLLRTFMEGSKKSAGKGA